MSGFGPNSHDTHNPHEGITPHKRGVQRARGAVYVVLGLFLTLVAIPVVCLEAPEYLVPECCAALECAHGYENGTDGGLYCRSYPPKEVMMARISPSVIRARLAASTASGIMGLLSAASMPISGLMWLIGVWPGSRIARRCALACRLAPLLALVLLPTSVALRLVYGIPVM